MDTENDKQNKQKKIWSRTINAGNILESDGVYGFVQVNNDAFQSFLRLYTIYFLPSIWICVHMLLHCYGN